VRQPPLAVKVCRLFRLFKVFPIRVRVCMLGPGLDDVSLFIQPIVTPRARERHKTWKLLPSSARQPSGRDRNGAGVAFRSRGDPPCPLCGHRRRVDGEAVGRRHAGLSPSNFPRYLSRACRAGSPTRSSRHHRQCDRYPIVAETIIDVIAVSSGTSQTTVSMGLVCLGSHPCQKGSSWASLNPSDRGSLRTLRTAPRYPAKLRGRRDALPTTDGARPQERNRLH
jgi:hypothetical protein